MDRAAAVVSVVETPITKASPRQQVERGTASSPGYRALDGGQRRQSPCEHTPWSVCVSKLSCKQTIRSGRAGACWHSVCHYNTLERRMPCTCWIRGSALQDSRSLPTCTLCPSLPPAALTDDCPPSR
jgi:hypothetical protein